MTVPPRRYDLPNCTLVLEGLGNADGLMTAVDARPLMSMLTSAECHFIGQEEPLRGGLEFFQGLVIAVSRYAQEFLSGVAIPATKKSPSDVVTITTIAPNCHRLMVASGDALSTNNHAQPNEASGARHVDLTTVQLFDLVEAIDQFLADDRTLPGLTIPLAPLSRRYLPDDGKALAKAAPAAIGISGLALASLAFFMMPIPTVQRPKDLHPAKPGKESVQPKKKVGTSASPSPLGKDNNLASPATPSPSATAQPAPSTPDAKSSSASPSPDASKTGTTIEQPQAVNPEPALTAPTIKDSAKLDTLRKQLYTKLDNAWKVTPSFGQPLSYQVTVGGDGAIVGYKPVDEMSRINDKQVPLLDLLYLPTTGGQANPEAIAQFKVVFKPSGVLEVSPWDGDRPSTAPPSPTP